MEAKLPVCETAAAIVGSFLQDAGNSDEAVSEYVTMVVSDQDEDIHGKVEALDDILCGLGGTWLESHEHARRQRLQQLLFKVRSVQLPCQAPSSSQDAQDAALQVKQTAKLSPLLPDVPENGHPATTDAQMPELTNICQPANCLPVSNEALCTLAALAPPGVSAEFLQHVLSNHKGQLETAGAWLVECEDVVAAERHWRNAVQSEQAAAEQDAAKAKAERARLFARYDLQSVAAAGGKVGSGTSKKAQRQAHAQLTPWQGDSGQKGVRFRDGRVVSTRGERFICEQVKEEYDGGARGKVKTKGKRGVGWA